MSGKTNRVVLIGAECEENLALRYIRSSLEQAGCEVLQIQFDDAGDTEYAAQELAGSRADLAGFSMVFTYRAGEFSMLAARARELGYNGHIVAGGHFAAFNAEALLRDCPAFDSVAIGEGERIMADLASNLDNPAAVNGLVWRDKLNKIVRNGPAAPVTDLDSLPPPTRRSPPDSYLGLPIANMLSSRGCTHACHFCSISAWARMCGGPRFRMRAPSRVAAEMGALYRQGYRLFNFHDDNFLLDDREANLARIRTLRDALHSEGVGPIGFAIKARPDRIDEEAFRTLRFMGLFRVFVGIEAGTTDSLTNLGRRQSVEDNERALAVLNGLDLHACFNILMFNPDSTIEDVLGNIAFMERHALNPMNFCRAEVYSGTPLEERLRSQNRLRGTYWGHGYTIADERAQRMFELTHALLFERHHGEQNLHHLAMRVDYERQLLAAFFQCPDGTRALAQAYVRRVNTASAALLRRVAALAAESPDDEALRRDLDAAIRSDTDALVREGHDTLTEVRRHATKSGVGRRHRTPAAGLAATIALTTGVVASGQSHVFEMAAPPPRTEPSREPKQTDATNRTARADRPPDGDIRQLGAVASTVYATIEPSIVTPQNAEVEFWIDKDAGITYVAVYKQGMESKAGDAELSEKDAAVVRRLLDELGDAKFAVREKATRELKAMGAKAVEVVRTHGIQSSDPEVQERCKTIVAESDCFVPMTDQAAMEAAVKGLRLNVPEEQRGKRYLGSLDLRQIQRLRMTRERRAFPGHICEMAPAARD